MLSFSQLEFTLASPLATRTAGRDPALEALTRDLLLQHGAIKLADRVIVEWSSRLRTAAGRAEYGTPRIVLNCRLAAFGQNEIDRTLRHELAHLLAQSRAGRRRVAPHGEEWRRACTDLGIAGEPRCHELPFPIRRQERRYIYACPHCRRHFPRTRRLRRTSACLSCCRAFNRGQYDRRFKLELVVR